MPSCLPSYPDGDPRDVLQMQMVKKQIQYCFFKKYFVNPSKIFIRSKMILPNGATFEVRSLPRVAKVKIFLNVSVWFFHPQKMKALRAVQLTVRRGANFSTLPGLISKEFDLAPETAERLFRASNGRKYDQIFVTDITTAQMTNLQIPFYGLKRRSSARAEA